MTLGARRACTRVGAVSDRLPGLPEDSVRTGAPTFIELTNNSSRGYCDPQCNYDNYVYVPRKPDGSAHSPDTVYVLGSNAYGEAASGTSNGRAVLLSTDAGATFTDMTYDDADDLQPHGIHPDQHSIVTHPADWKRFLETSGRGSAVERESSTTRAMHEVPGLAGGNLATCMAVTKRIPEPRVHQQGLIRPLLRELQPNRPGEPQRAPRTTVRG